MRRLRHLQQLVLDAQYVVDEDAVAEAILVRALARRLVPEVEFRSDRRDARVRSFRPAPNARSFRPCRPSVRRDAMGARR
jgi:hypothetical protein